jgi:hypothetical protein
MATQGSMAAWCTHRTGEADASAEIHFNYWRVTQKSRFFWQKLSPSRDFVEVGVLVTNPSKIETIQIFLPFEVGDDGIKDCGPLFGRVRIAQGIFNEALTCNLATNPHRVDLLLEKDLYCRVHLFPASGDKIDARQLARTSESEGTLLIISRTALDQVCISLPQDGRAYFRLRAFLPENNPRPFISVMTPQDRWLQSGYEEIECVDFRLNEARTLPQTVESLMRGSELPVPLTKVAFLTAIPVAAELAGTSLTTHKNRVLEHAIWNEYVTDGLTTDMMVYHWRSGKGTVDDFSAFVKLRIRRTSVKILLTYLGIAFIFGVAGNLFASRIDAWFSSKDSIPAKQVATPLLAPPTKEKSK